ncbi:MAG: invasion associated locus B family protein [Parvibaculum sp.]|nr:invasion associated locus B family protein [Parvibaculum sp.]
MLLRHAALAIATATLMLTGLASPTLAADPAPAPALRPAAETKPVIKKFETWSTRCDEDSVSKKLTACHAFVDVRGGPEKKQMLYLGFGYLEKDSDNLFAFAITPLGTALPPGMGFNIDDKEKFSAPFAFCTPRGCQTEVKLNEAQVKALKNGAQIKVLFALVGQGQVAVPLELKGVSAAINSLPKPAAKKS